MTKENQDDSFIILQESEVTKLEHEALNAIRFGNNSLETQFKRDIELMSLAIVDYGHLQRDKIKAEALLKSMLFLFFGQVCYRHRLDQCFYPLNTLDAYFKSNTTLTHFPIASILLHGSRALIEFPNKIAPHIMDWLITNKNSWRYLATHGISALTEVEVIVNNFKESVTDFPIYKCLKEEKVNGTQAAINFMSDSIANLVNACSEFSAPTQTQDKLDIPEHYGIDLALGGVDNPHFVSKKIIQNNGEHGHLYINFYQGVALQSHSGILLGIEQSAPGKPDQYGGNHDLHLSDKSYSASGGDFFCKKPSLSEIYQKEYQGLTQLPFASYYDSLWNLVTEAIFISIKTSFEKCQCLLSLLSKEKKILFIKQILSSSGGANQQDFDQLFDSYFEEVPNIKMKNNRLLNTIKKLRASYRQLYQEKQQAEAEALMQLLRLKEQVQNLKYEKELSQQEAKKEIIQCQQQLFDVQLNKNTWLFYFAKGFMHAVIQKMGWRASYSQKQNIMLGLQQLNAAEIELTDDHIRNLLKNFISVSLMNRYAFNEGPTHSAKACVHALNLPQYQPLNRLLFFHTAKIDYNGLLTWVAGHQIAHKQIYTSAKYQKNLYRFYQREDNKKNQINENTLIATIR